MNTENQHRLLKQPKHRRRKATKHSDSQLKLISLGSVWWITVLTRKSGLTNIPGEKTAHMRGAEKHKRLFEKPQGHMFTHLILSVGFTIFTSPIRQKTSKNKSAKQACIVFSIWNNYVADCFSMCGSFCECGSFFHCFTCFSITCIK